MITYVKLLLNFVHYISELKRNYRAKKYQKNIELEQKVCTETSIEGYEKVTWVKPRLLKHEKTSQYSKKTRNVSKTDVCKIL